MHATCHDEAVSTAQNWALLGIVGTLATGLLAAVFTLHQSLRGSMGDLRGSMGDLRASMNDLRDSMNTRFDSVERRLDGLDRDVQVLFRDRP